MRVRDVVALRDLLKHQDRVVLRLSCDHVISITGRELQCGPALALRIAAGPKQWECHFCDDATVEESREEKTATQLWKEAGEP